MVGEQGGKHAQGVFGLFLAGRGFECIGLDGKIFVWERTREGRAGTLSVGEDSSLSGSGTCVILWRGTGVLITVGTG